LLAKEVNVITKNKRVRLEIKNVLETPSNRFLARQNVITKGAIVETELGKVRITRILDSLEAQGLIERRRRGMTNIIILKN
jgi:ribosomal protein S8E